MFDEEEKLFVKCIKCGTTISIYVANVIDGEYCCDKCIGRITNE